MATNQIQRIIGRNVAPDDEERVWDAITRARSEEELLQNIASVVPSAAQTIYDGLIAMEREANQGIGWLNFLAATAGHEIRRSWQLHNHERGQREHQRFIQNQQHEIMGEELDGMIERANRDGTTLWDSVNEEGAAINNARQPALIESFSERGRREAREAREFANGQARRFGQELHPNDPTTLDDIVIPENTGMDASGTTDPTPTPTAAAARTSGTSGNNNVSKETPISTYPSLTYGLQETHTTILPWTGWVSIIPGNCIQNYWRVS